MSNICIDGQFCEWVVGLWIESVEVSCLQENKNWFQNSMVYFERNDILCCIIENKSY